MHDGRSAMPECATSATPVIPGWRVILSNRGRFWASRAVPFTRRLSGIRSRRSDRSRALRRRPLRAGRPVRAVLVLRNREAG